MDIIRYELVNDAIKKAFALTDTNIHNNLNKKHEFMQQTILTEESLTKIEKLEAIKILNIRYNRDKIIFNSGEKFFCENCQSERFSTLYCENCIRNYLKDNFSNWTSGNNDIDDLIKNCQMNSLTPHMIVEWIPYYNLQNIKYFTRGGYSEIYIADWIDGGYSNWDSEQQQLKRFGTHEVILKRLENINNVNRSWFEEAKSHLTISSKWVDIVQCYGLTQDPETKDYMLVMHKMDSDLRNYLQQYHNQLTWKERIQIIIYIIGAIYRIHNENAIYRDLHSGNILYFQEFNSWYIGDLGFCGPANKSLNSIYGNLPYIAPEVISGKKCTFASDIYSIAMLMWEIASGQPPFAHFNHDYDLAMNIVNGIRPKLVSGIPLEYKELMEQCWDADPEKRPDIGAVLDKIKKLRKLYYQNIPEDNFNNKDPIKNFFNKFNLFQLSQQKSLKINVINNSSKLLFTSKIYQFNNFPEPRNATEGD
ncbi:kinase-like domain-containing protein [Glomus cerebriforme]|uniref:Kinase-like domain-containing protein n=1 Tax=Glomus cerebriforme TaxID=658196 RepID=A0A397SL91_9GLOM|nr:kinase-like domain-containing protein [Glomus cerebriforme]